VEMGIFLFVGEPPEVIRCSELMKNSGISGTIVYSSVTILVPDSPRSDRNGKIDWIGAYSGVGGLILFNFVWK